MKNKALLFICILSALIFFSCGEDDPRKPLFDVDEEYLNSTTVDPSDSLALELQSYLSVLVNEELEPSEFAYHTRISDDNKRLLVLIKMPKLKKAKKESRTEIVSLIQAWQMIKPSVKNLELYLGVKGQITWMITKKPNTSAENSLVELESDLYDFYGPLSQFQTSGSQE